ncbi:MAG: sulfur carrier protein ThiS [Candidatus Omnitrophica bacterium]|nr:sulfur carrier protein ThiS [Candidatus Omnitrophota bacterium]
MKVQINGQIQLIEESISLEQFLGDLKVCKEAVVCELNRSIIQKDQYSKTYLSENDSLEIVHFVGGG